MLDITQAIWPDDMDQMGYMSDHIALFVEDPGFSQVLGPTGEPLEYEPHPFGFDLRMKQ